MEAKAWFHKIIGEVKDVLHADLYGGLAGANCSEAAWEVMLQIEPAFVSGDPVVMCSLDYKKFFDSFDHRFSAGLLLAHGLPPMMVSMWLDLITNMERVTKIGPSLGTSEKLTTALVRGTQCHFSQLCFLSLRSLGC